MKPAIRSVDFDLYTVVSYHNIAIDTRQLGGGGVGRI